MATLFFFKRILACSLLSDRFLFLHPQAVRTPSWL
uniref:Uncharacterized protein n=1 Tax=Anguilla anguilla TaxID=7936 RepID=A0A0E9TEM0_ANGAN